MCVQGEAIYNMTANKHYSIKIPTDDLHKNPNGCSLPGIKCQSNGCIYITIIVDNYEIKYIIYYIMGQLDVLMIASSREETKYLAFSRLKHMGGLILIMLSWIPSTPIMIL